MFQNAKIAEAHGAKVMADGMARGLSKRLAGQQGRHAAKAKLAELDKWVTENVGLD
jgi:hypothetical protein